MFDAQKKVAAQSKDVADKLIFQTQENEFSTEVKGDVDESVTAQSKDVTKKVKFDAQENNFSTEVNEDGDESTSGSTVDCSTLMNTPLPRKSKEMNPSSRSPNTRNKDNVIYTGLSNMKINVSNPKQWPKCHWSFQEKCYLPRFHPSPCHHPGCYNYAHSRCLLEWCHHQSIPFDDPKVLDYFVGNTSQSTVDSFINGAIQCREGSKAKGIQVKRRTDI
jgi:hypothetical protein